MSTKASVGSSLDPALAVLKRDFLIAWSYRFTLISQMMTALFSLVLFYYVSRLVSVGTFSSPDEYYAFVVIGMVLMQVSLASFIRPGTALRQELVAGTFERLLLSPFGAVRSMLSLLLFPLVQALLVAISMVLFAGLVYGVSVQWSTAALAIPVGVLSAFAFAPFGILFLAALIVAKQASAAGTWVMTGITFVAGFYFPVALLPGWIRWLSEVQPFSPAVDLFRHLLVGIPLSEPAWQSLVKLGVFTAVLLPAAIWALARAVRFARRRGTVIEY